ncbi:hypothetical protein IQ265_01055 [Nodosilinea sp. LEGE 06152]|uniref:hypothetical protein n=1 Tax=Nodosilinea sp. LEGE 06152 TaxID=2777966 RepID=UPI0018828EDE|nr:hypothetical protein [Nodosilinea sp. LEGE 06152]MBE9155435.1 hypothetical protein [Nodosilinea sp. LEGE 06152]
MLPEIQARFGGALASLERLAAQFCSFTALHQSCSSLAHYGTQRLTIPKVT